MMNEKEIASVINNLIETLKDGEKGFKEAADGVKDPELKSLFTQYWHSGIGLLANSRRS